MRDAFQLSGIVGKAALIETAGCFALMWTLMLFGFNPNPEPSGGEIALGVLAFLLPIGVATAWMFRKLQTVYSRREARAVSTAFCLFTPISLGVSFVLAELTGGYAEMLVGPRLFGLIGAFVGAAVFTALLSLLVCVLVLRVTRLAIRVEQSN